MSPLVGAHTLLGAAASYLFRLNPVVTITGVYITNPWTVIPIYTFATWCGAKILGVDFAPSDVDFSCLTTGTIIQELGYLLKSFIVGSLTLGTVVSVISYPVTYSLFKKFHRDE